MVTRDVIEEVVDEIIEERFKIRENLIKVMTDPLVYGLESVAQWESFS